ncbi:SMP-30/gluconolactonase/LRE family protein [Rubrivirga marina]|uniref:SMP-30/Gluconolactonase/LRE-like region domain-containing protein n=1 Tax=Rubrivirga marina TaxID=1196024 RepID=A0A271IXG4_9BACT|nr:SMP-30/gluconolactonase/LRE family protein [Rubrivirga marina]PAP75810.1 hypothetical protein BSZ37_04810 [Rubrivirga marina]
MPLRLVALVLVFTIAASAQSPVAPGAEPERIASGFQFTEGPVWFEGTLLFSDIPANRVYRWDPESGQTETFLSPSQKSNGLALDADGNLLLAQHAAQRVARLDGDVETALAEAYEGDAFNSPNDLTLHPDGSIYFSDPTWGLEGRPSETGFTGVYRLDPDGTVDLLADDLHQPNGVAFSPDLATFYVSTSDERTVVAYDHADGALSNGRVFATLTGGTPFDAADGMEVDGQGRLYVAGPRGVWIFAPDGTVLDVVDVPDQTTNVAFGPDDTLYITSGPGVYRLSLVAGTTAGEAGPVRLGLTIETVAPNPSRGLTAVTIRLDRARAVGMDVVDALGRTVRTLDLGPLAAGEHRAEVDLGGLAPGVYTVRLEAGGQRVTRAVTVAR